MPGLRAAASYISVISVACFACAELTGALVVMLAGALDAPRSGPSRQPTRVEQVMRFDGPELLNGETLAHAAPPAPDIPIARLVAALERAERDEALPDRQEARDPRIALTAETEHKSRVLIPTVETRTRDPRQNTVKTVRTVVAALAETKSQSKKEKHPRRAVLPAESGFVAGDAPGRMGANKKLVRFAETPSVLMYRAFMGQDS